MLSLALAALFVGAAGACSLFVDTGGLDTQTDSDGGDAKAPMDGAPDVNPIGDAGDSGAFTDADANACPSGNGPTMVPIPNAGYCIDSTEVTRGQYAAFLATSPSTSGQPAECAWNASFVPNPWNSNLTTYPVVYIDWCDAYAYCKWAGKRMCGAIGGGTLAQSLATDPAASQWYRACSANGALAYPYGSSYSATACNAPTGDAAIAPVASFSNCVGGYGGIFDMAGNVEEWQDSCDGVTGPNDNCRDQAGTFGWMAGDPQGSTRCDFLDTDPRGNHLPDVGIRCCSP